MRDAGEILSFPDQYLRTAQPPDIYDDLAIYAKRHTGGLGVLMMRLGELFVGPDMALVSGGTQQSEQSCPPTQEEQVQVKRELTENCVVSELLASMVLFAMLLTDMLLDSWGVKGYGPVLNNFNQTTLDEDDAIHTRRERALAVYAVITCCQIVGIFISHQVLSPSDICLAHGYARVLKIIRHKNALIAKLHAIRMATVNQQMPLPGEYFAVICPYKSHFRVPAAAAGMKWHFFLVKILRR